MLRGSQSRQFQARPVHDHLPELADSRMHTETHDVPPFAR